MQRRWAAWAVRRVALGRHRRRSRHRRQLLRRHPPMQPMAKLNRHLRLVLPSIRRINVNSVTKRSLGSLI